MKRPIFDDWKSVFHLILGSLTLMVINEIAIVILLLFTVYQLIEYAIHRDVGFIGDIAEYLCGAGIFAIIAKFIY